MRHGRSPYRLPRLRPRREELPQLGLTFMVSALAPLMMALLNLLFSAVGERLVFATATLVTGLGVTW